MKEDTRYITVRVRMNDKEKNVIKKKAKLAGKTMSDFIRLSAMECVIKEKPDKALFDSMTKELGKFTRGLYEIERLLYHEDFIDERAFKREVKEWENFRKEIRERLL